MLKKLKKLELADIQLILSLLVALSFLIIHFDSLYLFLVLTLIFQVYIRSLNFSFLAYRLLNQAKMAKSLISIKVIFSAMRGIVTAFFIFLALKYFGLNYIIVLSAIFVLLSSMLIFGLLKNS